MLVRPAAHVNTRFTRARLPSRFPFVITCNYIDRLADFNRRPGIRGVKGGQRKGSREELEHDCLETKFSKYRNRKKRTIEVVGKDCLSKLIE